MKAQAPGAAAYEPHLGVAAPSRAGLAKTGAPEVALPRSERIRAALIGTLIGLALIVLAALSGLLLVAVVFGSGGLG